MTRELPTINNCSLVSNTYSGTMVDWTYRPELTQVGYPYRPQDYANVQLDKIMKDAERFTRAHTILDSLQPTTKEKKMADKSSRRIVRVFIVDTDENIPLEKCLIFRGEEQFTDATDQELFFEVDIKNILEQHNTYRAGVLDKKQTNKLGKEIYLEPIKIRDLTMTVVNVATF